MDASGLVEYKCEGSNLEVTEEMKDVFNRHGGFLVKGLLDEEELKQVFKTIELNENYKKMAYEIADKDDRGALTVLWNHPGHDVFGMLARSEKVAGTCEKLLGGEVYHYHTKLNMKNSETGGFDWHQDYGYWYKNGVLRPDQMSVLIALDPCTKENGCLQVLKGSHRCGRVDHGLIKGQRMVDLERLEYIRTSGQFDHIYVEMEPGDAIFFHCNVIHTSEANLSRQRRWVVVHCYNRADNDPVIDHHHPRYTPLVKVPNSAIKECTAYTDNRDKCFMTPKEDLTAKGVMVDRTQKDKDAGDRY